ncbi:MAG: hypothetical protein Q7J84_04400 [Sulfuricaulis sp.]|nr:hypothetical protein [Sulfuricaulis sp.]
MNRKILSAVVLAVATSLCAPWALADRGGRDGYREVGGQHAEKQYYHHDRGYHRGWYKNNHHGHHGYNRPASRHHRGHDNYYPSRRAASDYRR